MTVLAIIGALVLTAALAYGSIVFGAMILMTVLSGEVYEFGPFTMGLAIAACWLCWWAGIGSHIRVGWS